MKDYYLGMKILQILHFKEYSWNELVTRRQ